MADKITGQGFTPVDVAGGTRRTNTAQTAEGQTSQSAGGTSANTGDTVELTSSAVLLNRLEEIIANSPIVDQQRVDAIKQAISSGSYEINHQSIADQLIRLERELS